MLSYGSRPKVYVVCRKYDSTQRNNKPLKCNALSVEFDFHIHFPDMHLLTVSLCKRTVPGFLSRLYCDSTGFQKSFVYIKEYH